MKESPVYSFVRIRPTDSDWDLIENTYDSTVYKTRSWYGYLRLQGCEDFVVSVSKDGLLAGFFVGEKLRRGITLVASPFEGLGTAHQGLSMLKETTAEERISIYKHLADWLFSTRQASYLQVEDWQIRDDEIPADADFFHEAHRVKYVDLTIPEEQLYSNMHQDCKYSIRKAIKNGIVVRECANLDAFLDAFYAQLEDVFDKKGMTPTRDKENVRKLLQATWPEKTMLLEAITSEGDIAATAIVPIHASYAATWQTASFRKFQNLRPNEILRWEAMRRSKERGAQIINFCGTQAYKDKFNPVLIHTSRLVFCKYRGLLLLKQAAKKSYYGIRALLAKFKK